MPKFIPLLQKLVPKYQAKNRAKRGIENFDDIKNVKTLDLADWKLSLSGLFCNSNSCIRHIDLSFSYLQTNAY